MARTRKPPERSDETDSQLVVIGASAGGVSAIATLVGTLEPDFPAPIIVAQHLDPRRESHLPEILQHSSPLPVVGVDARTRLQAGTIYVVSANRNVEITDHEIAVRKGGRPRPMPSIDRLLESAAHVYGEGLVAVILTGAGSDGAAGARHVRLGGGTVVIENPETASFPAMPLSLAPTTVDVVADVGAIGPLLDQLVRGVYQVRRPDEEQRLTAFLDGVRDATGIDFAKYKRPTILRRLHRRMAAIRVSSLADYAEYTAQHPRELDRLASSFLIKVTEFFRDPDLFEQLSGTIIPELAAHAAANGGELRIWSAGCATGEEAYSLAIAAAAALEGRPDVKLRIFATDLDEEAIDFARRGTYPVAAVERVPATVRERYFTQSGSTVEVKPTIRSLIAFGQHDLAQRAPFPRIDLAVCRNVLIYFTNPLQRRALELFAFSLREGGYLVLGKAETAGPLAEPYVLADPRLKIYRRHGQRNAFPVHYLGVPPRRGLQTTANVPRNVRGSPMPRIPVYEPANGLRAEGLIQRLPVGVVVVDRKYDIASINLSARAMLDIHGAAVGQDLIHLARGISSSELRRGIDAAFRGEPWRTTWQIPMSETPLPDMRSLEGIAYRQPDDAGKDLVVLVLRDVSAEHVVARDLQAQVTEERGRAEHLAEQLTRVNELIRTIREANEELTTVNADLRAQNDELVVSNEEVQAATEEVETLNEEMQATNEELETLNEEMQATVEELNTTNDDLEARSNELQTLALSLEKQREESETERTRLEAILVSMADAVMVIDADGSTVLTNEAYERLFGDVEPTDFADDTGTPLDVDAYPRARAARGETFSATFTRAGGGGETRWFEASGRPLQQGGGVVVIRDISERSRQRIQNDFLMMLSHELRTPLTGLTAYLEMLARRTRGREDVDERDVRYIERAVNQAHRLNALVGELFDANRVATGNLQYDFEPVDLGAVAEEAVAVSRAIDDERIIAFDGGTARLVVSGDGHRLQQVVFNLAANALRHAPESRVEVRLRKRGRDAELAVRDWGPGIAPERLDKIFERFASRASSSDGLGLGLYIVKAIVDAHKGSIEIRSTPGEGSAFVVRIPLVRE